MMDMDNDLKLLEKILSKPIEHDGSFVAISEVRRILLFAIAEARADERAKCINALKEYRRHCDNCANDKIEMAIILLSNKKG